jgi:hypothetical protein
LKAVSFPLGGIKDGKCRPTNGVAVGSLDSYPILTNCPERLSCKFCSSRERARPYGLEVV